MENKKIAIIGAGSWGTAIAKILLEKSSRINWWVRKEETIAYFKSFQHNPNYLSSVEFDTSKITFYSNLNECIKNSDWLIFSIPSAFIHKQLLGLEESLDNKVIISAIKGVVPETQTIIADYFFNHFSVKPKKFGVIAGACHAEEVSLEKLSYLVVASVSDKISGELANLLSCDYIKVKTSEDIYGIEYASVLKNIYAIAAGIAHGLGYGDNYIAVLMSNAIREMKYFIREVYEMDRDTNQSSYLGDLLVTGYSTFSRNRLFGNMIGKGYTVQSAQAEMNMIAEGYYATKGVRNIKKTENLALPICSAVYKILYEGKSPKKVFLKLSEKLD